MVIKNRYEVLVHIFRQEFAVTSWDKEEEEWQNLPPPPTASRKLHCEWHVQWDLVWYFIQNCTS